MGSAHRGPAISTDSSGFFGAPPRGTVEAVHRATPSSSAGVKQKCRIRRGDEVRSGSASSAGNGLRPRLTAATQSVRAARLDIGSGPSGSPARGVSVALRRSPGRRNPAGNRAKTPTCNGLVSLVAARMCSAEPGLVEDVLDIVAATT